MGGVHSVAAQDANDPRNLLALCNSCHDETEHAETWGLTEEIGWRMPKWVTKPYAVPALLFTVNYHPGPDWYLLGQMGEYTWIDPTCLPRLEQATWRVLPENPMDLAASPRHVSARNRRIDWGGQSTG